MKIQLIGLAHLNRCQNNHDSDLDRYKKYGYDYLLSSTPCLCGGTIKSAPVRSISRLASGRRKSTSDSGCRHRKYRHIGVPQFVSSTVILGRAVVAVELRGDFRQRCCRERSAALAPRGGLAARPTCADFVIISLRRDTRALRAS